MRRLARIVRTSGAAAIAVVVAGLALLAPSGPVAAACTPTQQQEADLAFNSAAEFLALGRVNAAIPSLESALNICAEHIKTLEALGKAYRDAGDGLKARADSLTQAQAEGAAKMMTDRMQMMYEKSKSTYARLIALRGNETEAETFAGQALTFVRLKDYPNARASFMKARALTPDDCNILTNLALLHFLVQDYRNSVATFEEALQDCPDQADKIYPRLADACKKGADKETKIGNTAEAALLNQKYQTYAGESGGNTAFSLAVSKMKNQQYDEAIALFQQILQESPGKKPARLNLACWPVAT